jgi:GAF domain-containing protein
MTPQTPSDNQFERRQALTARQRFAALDAPADGTFDRIARMASTIFATPIATVSIVDEDRVWFAATEGLDGVTQVGTEPGLCASAVLQDGPYIVNDAQNDPRTKDHPLVTGALGLRFYAAAPIVTTSEHALGTVNVIDRRPHDVTEVTGPQITLLTELAGAVADLLEIRLSAIDAVRAERQRQRPDRPDRHDRPTTCELGARSGCAGPAVIKVVDSWGDSAWGCETHGEEALSNVPSTFLASAGDRGLNSYLNRPN